MEEGSITVLVDAKEEYTKQLISVLKPCIYQGIKSIYLDSKDICNQDNTPEKVLMVFQDLLSRIPKWSQDIINKEYERIMNVSKCDYIEDLLKVIYVSHIKVLTIVHSAQKNKKISLKVPNGSHFIHLCYIECAREFWKDPYLFSENVNKYELQKNMRDSEIMIAECIAETIRKQLPVRHILKEFLNEPDEDIEEAEEDIKEPINKKYMKKLESVVKKELKTTEKSGNAGEIDIDLIRKVIREELSSRPIETATTGTIKKELVETVIEKIVEQAQEVQDTITTDVISNPEDIKNDKLINEDTKKDDTKKEEPVKESVKESVKELVKELVKEPVNEVEVEASKNKNKGGEEEKEEKESEDEKQSASINDLIDELDDGGNISKVDDDIVIDAGEDINIDTKSVKQETKKEIPEIKISTIDEINLNLDELDDEFENQSDLELEEVDIKAKPEEIKKDTGNNYKFFNDDA
jgi:hypothetical protein